MLAGIPEHIIFSTDPLHNWDIASEDVCPYTRHTSDSDTWHPEKKGWECLNREYLLEQIKYWKPVEEKEEIPDHIIYQATLNAEWDPGNRWVCYYNKGDDGHWHPVKEGWSITTKAHLLAHQEYWKPVERILSNRSRSRVNKPKILFGHTLQLANHLRIDRERIKTIPVPGAPTVVTIQASTELEATTAYKWLNDNVTNWVLGKD